MNDKSKDFFKADVEEINTIEEEIFLAPPAELYDEAKKIAQTTTAEEKFPFTIQYDTVQKEFLQSMLQMVGAVVEADDEDGHMLDTRMNMMQLAFIKRLDCVERVKTDERINPFLAEEAEKPKPVQQEQQKGGDMTEQNDEPAQAVPVMTLAADEAAEVTADASSNTVSTDGTAAASTCNCPANKDMESAQTISVESYVSGCICCPCAEQWFKFVPTQSKTYTIYTDGSLDTVGTLYDCCGNVLATNDDFAGKLNFRIVLYLTAGTTYYVKVRAYGTATGSYTFRVTNRIFASSVTINKKQITLEKGVLYELPVTPNYTYKGYKGAQRIPGLSVSITPSNASEQKIWWYESYGNVLNCSYGWDQDGDRYIHVIASNSGIAKLYAEDWNGNGTNDVVSIAIVNPGETFVPATGISLSATNLTLNVGDYTRLTATVSPTNATGQEVIWRSSNTAVATVTTFGRIKAVGIGTANIIAEAMDGSGVIAYCVVTSMSITSKGILRVKTTNGADLKLAPKAESESIGVIPYNQEISLAKAAPQNSNWYAVYGQMSSGNLSYGWCLGTNLEIKTEYGVLVDVDSLTVRSTPETTGKNMGKIQRGDSVEILEKHCATNNNYTWHKIVYNDTVGYVVAGNNTPNFTFIVQWNSLPDVSMLTPVSDNRRLNQREMENNSLIIYDYLSNKVATPWSKNAICALLGNMQAESTINPGRWQNGTGPAFGLVQWEFQVEKLFDYLNNNYNGQTDNLYGQLEYLIMQCEDGTSYWNQGSFPSNLNFIKFDAFRKSNDSVETLTRIFLWAFEKPGTPHEQNRINYANSWFTYFS